MDNQELTATELAMMEALTKQTNPNEDAVNEAFRLGYIQGFRSCMAATNRGIRQGQEPRYVIKSLHSFFSHLLRWQQGESPKPMMNLWK